MDGNIKNNKDKIFTAQWKADKTKHKQDRINISELEPLKDLNEKPLENTYKTMDEPRKNIFRENLSQILVVLSATFGVISDGMQYGWSAPILEVLRRPESPIKITEQDESWIESLYMAGGLIGLPITIYMVDKVGRKATILAGSCCNLIAWLMLGLGNSVVFILIARTITGAAADIAFVTIPMYIAEIAAKNIRGFLAGLIYLMMLMGVLLIYSIGPFVPLYISSLIGAVVVTIQLVSFCFMPESPYYLIGKDRHLEAKQALTRLRSNSNIEKELEEITAAVARQRSEKGRPQDLILVKSNRKAFIIMTVLNFSQHYSGISVMLMNLHHILDEADSVYLTENTVGIVFAALMLISATIADFFVDKFGRKILLSSSSLLTGISLLVLAIFFSLKKSGMDVQGISWLPIASVMCYAVVFKYGLGMVPIVMTAELFPAKIKAVGMTCADAMYVIFALLSIELYQYLGKNYGLDAPFYVFAASCLFTALFTVLYIPETKGKSLEEIQFILKGETYVSPVTKEQEAGSCSAGRSGDTSLPL